jgi:hypothetical protein
MSQKKGIKHLIQCHCVLPQYRNREDPVFHKFIVFSIQNEEGEIIPKIAQCNNCSVTHRVIDLCRSEIVHGSEDITSTITIDEMRGQIGERLSLILEKNGCDLPTWENVNFIMDNEIWGERVAISKNRMAGSTQIKTVTILGKENFKIETHLRQDDMVGGFSLV